MRRAKVNPRMPVVKEHLSKNIQSRWIHSKAQLADALTKPTEPTTLRSCLRIGQYPLYDEDMNLKQRISKRASHQWYQKKGAADPSSDDRLVHTALAAKPTVTS